MRGAWLLLFLAGCEGSPVGEVASDAGTESDATSEAEAGSDLWELVYEDPNAQANDALHDFQAFAEDDVWVVGKNQQILWYQGASWSPYAQIPGANLFGIWGDSSNRLTAVGAAAFNLDPIVLHFDGDIWTSGAPYPATLPALTDVWGIGTQRYFTSLDGQIFQDDPVVFPNDRYHLAVVTGGCPNGNPVSPDLHAIDGNTLDNILAAGDEGVLAHKDADGWIRLCGPDLTVHYVTVFHQPNTAQFFVGSNYLGLLWFIDRDQPLAQVYQNLAIPDADKAYIQRISGDASRIIAVGDLGTILYFNITSDPRPLPSPTSDTLFGVALAGVDTVYVCGRANRVWRASLAALVAAPR